METLKIKGNDTLWLHFHGTGGDKTSLLYITGEMDPQASILAFEGNVGLGAARRFFAPLEAGQLNRQDFDQRVEDFLAYLDQLDLSSYKEIKILGYSNGANFALGLLEKRPDLASKVYLLHPSQLGWADRGPIENQSWVITMGANDQAAPAGPIIQWIKRMPEEAQARIETKLFDAYHAVTDPEMDWLQGK